MFFPERTKGLCSFSLTEEKKEPKETVTPSPFKGDVNRETQKPTFLCNVLVSRDDGLYLIIHRVVPRYQNITRGWRLLQPRVLALPYRVTDGAARGEQSLLWLSRVVKEVDHRSRVGDRWMLSLVLSFAPKERTIWGLGVPPFHKVEKIFISFLKKRKKTLPLHSCNPFTLPSSPSCGQP